MRRAVPSNDLPADWERGPNMDEVSRGVATAALTIQSVLLQALVAKGIFTQSEAVEVADKALLAAASGTLSEDEEAVMEVTAACLGHIREGLLGMGNQ
jgi:hypothetical protein